MSGGPGRQQDPRREASSARLRLSRSTADAARDLLGWLLQADDGLTLGRIVETEAYLGPEDPASHAAMYRTERVAIMGCDPGLAYVYRSYGIHAMLNVVAHEPGGVGAVLIRAVEPLAGAGLMAERRGLPAGDARALCSGPGKLARAFGITLEDHGRDLLADPGLRLIPAPGPPPDAVASGRRIGITRGAEAELRFWERGNPHVSRR
ncbi:MAG: DNA-3-methyladenine glycosylase [Chloroflexota bacterium]